MRMPANAIMKEIPIKIVSDWCYIGVRQTRNSVFKKIFKKETCFCTRHLCSELRSLKCVSQKSDRIREAPKQT